MCVGYIDSHYTFDITACSGIFNEWLDYSNLLILEIKGLCSTMKTAWYQILCQQWKHLKLLEKFCFQIRMTFPDKNPTFTEKQKQDFKRTRFTYLLEMLQNMPKSMKNYSFTEYGHFSNVQTISVSENF